jgi:hypothetical protein
VSLPDNRNTTTVDLLILFGMPGAIAVLLAIIAYLAMTMPGQ